MIGLWIRFYFGNSAIRTRLPLLVVLVVEWAAIYGLFSALLMRLSVLV